MAGTRPRLTPGPEHPITIEPTASTVVIRRGDVQLARSDRALALREANYPVVYYLPIDDVQRHRLQDSERHTYCPYKGEASYFDVSVEGDDGPELQASVWYYGDPYPDVKQITGHVAFYADRFTIETVPS